MPPRPATRLLQRLGPTTAWLLLGASASLACAPEPTTADQVQTRAGPPLLAQNEALTAWQSCYELFKPSGEPQADLKRLTGSCGALGGMRPITEVHVAAQNEQDPVDRYTFYVPQAGRCYRVFAVSDSTVKDLDLLLRDPRGSDIIADLTHDSWPVLPPNSPACFQSAGLYMLEVSVYKGSGRYALQIWGR